MDTWHSDKIIKTYNQKYLIEDDFKLLNDAFLVPIGAVNHRKDFNIRMHVFLYIIGMPFYRYLAWRCKHLRISLKRLVEELKGIRVALVKDKTGRGCELMVEEMVEADEVVLAPGSGAIYGRLVRIGIWRTNVLVGTT